MGKIKTKASVATKDMRRAHKMAENFAIKRTKLMLFNFLNTSGLAEAHYELYLKTLEEGEVAKIKGTFIEEMMSDLDLQFGGVLALAYALGHIDSSAGAKTPSESSGPKISLAPDDIQPKFDAGPPAIPEGTVLSPNVDRPGKIITDISTVGLSRTAPIIGVD
jgi:hypothetical protein